MRRFIPLLAFCLTATLVGPSAFAADSAPAERHPVEPQITSIPRVRGPIAVTARSWPFAAAAHSVTARDLSKNDYVEEEYFVSGTANVYEWPALNKLMSFARGPYTTR